MELSAGAANVEDCNSKILFVVEKVSVECGAAARRRFCVGEWRQKLWPLASDRQQTRRSRVALVAQSAARLCGNDDACDERL